MTEGEFAPFIEGLIRAEEHDRKLLKSCPFCNAHDNDVYVDEFWERYNNPYFVSCDKCGACGPYADTKEKAIENWNRRVKE